MEQCPPDIEPEVVPLEVVAVLRGKSPAEKFEMVCEMWRFARQLCEAGVRAQYPGWDNATVLREVARRIGVGSE